MFSGSGAVIRSRDNRTIKRLNRLLGSARARAEEGVAVLEGWHLLRACLAAPAFGAAGLEAVVVSESGQSHPEAVTALAALGPARIPVQVAADDIFARIGEPDGTNAVMALLKIPSPPPAAAGSGMHLCLDALQDPGNVGTLIRTAAATGVASVILGHGCADPWSPKSLRAGMGGQFFIRLAASADLSAWLAASGLRTIGACEHAARSLYETSLDGDIALVLGSEGQGLAPEVRDRLTETVRIPMAPGTDSLNVAAAGAVLLYERVRQRGGLAG